MMSGRLAVAATLGLSCALAVVLAVTGWRISRQQLRVPVAGSEGWWEEEFGRGARQVARLEALWEEALDARAQAFLAGEDPRDGSVAGVRSVYRLDSSKKEPQWLAGETLTSPPLLGKYAETEDAWVFPDQALVGSGWMDEGDGRRAYVRGNGAAAVVMVLDPERTAKVVRREARLGRGESELGGSWQWLAPQESATPRGDADESIRQLSSFGAWTLRIWNPVERQIRYQLPLLIGGFVAAGVVMLAGGWLAWAQAGAWKRAAEQVSFANQVSHELRTPLTNLMLNADLAIDDAARGGRSVSPRLGVMREEMERLSRIVENVLIFSRGRHRTRQLREVDLVAPLGEVVEGFRFPLARKDMSLSWERPDTCHVATDPEAVGRIVVNLLSNAEKYAGAGSAVRVRLAQVQGRLRLEVADDGPGIPAGQERRVFRPFVRGGSSTREGVSGTGLGLAISRSLAGELGGRLMMVSAARGACFRLEIPLAERRAG
ncbi:sensor histidine kinase [Haloferula sargassicola]